MQRQLPQPSRLQLRKRRRQSRTTPNSPRLSNSPPGEAAHSEWKARWSAWLATVDATTREHFERHLFALEKPAAAQRPERTVTPRAEDADLAAANEAPTKLAELIAAGDVRGSRQAATKLYQQFTAGCTEA